MTEKSKKNYLTKVVDIEKLTLTDIYSLKLKFEKSVSFKPGQYLSILCGNLTLRRPFSVAGFDEENNIATVLFKTKGIGTTFLSSLKKDFELQVLAPLGNGFNIDTNKKALIIAAGIGVAPIMFLKNHLDKLNIPSFFLFGAKNQYEVLSLSNYDLITTDDGSLGEKGFVCDYMEHVISKFNPEKIYACGPSVVLRKIGETAEKYSIDCEVAVEKVMACGIGVCRGCVIKIKKNNDIVNATVCKDGPVFNSKELVW